jgi:hypothetical protein
MPCAFGYLRTVSLTSARLPKTECEVRLLSVDWFMAPTTPKWPVLRVLRSLLQDSGERIRSDQHTFRRRHASLSQCLRIGMPFGLTAERGQRLVVAPHERCVTAIATRSNALVANTTLGRNRLWTVSFLLRAATWAKQSAQDFVWSNVSFGNMVPTSSGPSGAAS